MSNNSQDEPDEYEIIFDGSKTDANSIEGEEVLEVNSPDIVSSSEEIISAGDETSDDFITDGASDTGDQDIDDGIFAPARREKPASKKSSSLMWAVSLLAFVGVGAFAYVTNPDILSKVTSNLQGQDNITLPSETVATDITATDITETSPVSDTGQGSIQTATPSDTQPADVSVEKPDVVVPDDQPNVAPSDVLAEGTSISQVSDTEAVDSAVVDSNPSPTVSAPAEQVSAVNAVVPNDVPEIEGKKEVGSTPVVEPVPVVSTPPDVSTAVVPESEKKVAAVTAAPGLSVQPLAQSPDTNISIVPPSSDVIVPTADKVDDVVNEDHPKSSEEAEVTETTVSPVVEPVVTKAKKETPVENDLLSDDKKPVIVNSKEEQKRLDDANLNKYFDSPSGQMLKNIPAPSMDPKRGDNQSIIVVNKKAKNAAQPPKPVGKVTIETTSLTSQIISANRAVKLGRYDAAKDMYDELYKLNPRDVQILSGRALLLQKMGFADQAISAYEELLDVYPDNADAIVNLAGLIRKQYPAVALSKLLDLHMKVPNNTAVTAQLGVAYADSGNYADALRYLGDAASMDPKNALHFYNMAIISEKASKTAQAISYYEKALELDAIYGDGKTNIPRERIYDRLAQIRGN